MDYSDEETVSSWNDATDDETDIDDLIFEPEEISKTKYNIIIYERLNHWLDSRYENYVKLFIVHFRLKKFDMAEIINLMLTMVFHSSMRRPLKVGIGECIYRADGYCEAIIKTYWLKIIQRTWKNICKNRKLIILKRLQPSALKYKEIYGRWPDNCINYPYLKGMLYKLSRTLS